MTDCSMNQRGIVKSMSSHGASKLTLRVVDGGFDHELNEGLKLVLSLTFFSHHSGSRYIPRLPILTGFS